MNVHDQYWDITSFSLDYAHVIDFVLVWYSLAKGLCFWIPSLAIAHKPCVRGSDYYILLWKTRQENHARK